MVLPWLAKLYPDGHGVGFRVRRIFTMVAATFDTHAAVKVMRDAGIDEPLAEAIVTVIQMAKAGRTRPVTQAQLESNLKDFERRITTRLAWRLLVMVVLIFATVGIFSSGGLK